LDESAARRSPANPGVIRTLAQASWARSAMTALPPGATLEAHTHDFPYLSLHLLGSYSEEGGLGPVRIAGPGAAFHPAGAQHSNRIGAVGLTTVVIEFDPGWLARRLPGPGLPARSAYWLGGAVARRAAALARACLESAEPATTLQAAAAFLARAMSAPPPPPGPDWLAALDELADEAWPRGAASLGRRLGVSGPWLARAYRAHRGEGLAEAQRRWRVERAVRLLADSDQPLAAIALDAGFCDQSHMNRAFRAVLRRTPAQVRHEGRAAAA
jgi:AraC-like DNA-binding protein